MLVAVLSLGVVAPGLGQNTEPVLAAGHGRGVADTGEHLQGLPVAALGLDIVAADLRDLADLMDPGRAQR